MSPQGRDVTFSTIIDQNIKFMCEIPSSIEAAEDNSKLTELSASWFWLTFQGLVLLEQSTTDHSEALREGTKNNGESFMEDSNQREGSCPDFG